MAGSSVNVSLPHALTVAYQRLCEALDLGNRDLEAHQRFSNAREICCAAEAFVHEFRRTPAWRAELERRSSVVEQLTASGTAYDQAKTEALRSYKGRPREPSASKLAIEGLRNAQTNPIFLPHIDAERSHLEEVLNHGVLGLSGSAKDAFGRWLHECRKIQLEAKRLEADGCYYLHYVYQDISNPSQRSRWAKAQIASETFLGGALLKPMRPAADSLMAWAAENRACSRIADLVDAEAARLEKGVAEAQPTATACGHSSPETPPHIAADPSDAVGRKTVGQQVPTAPPDHGQDQTGSGPAVLDDPITLEDAAELLLVGVKTVYNRGTEERPKPEVSCGRGRRAIFSYHKLRPWLLDNFPDREDRLPEGYGEVKKLLSAPKCPPGKP